MKKILLSLVLLCGVAFTAQAQEVGSKWVSGTVGVWSSKTGEAKRTTDYKFIPEIGYVVSENIGVGIKFGYERSNIEVEDLDAMAKADIYSVNPFVRYTFCKGDIGGLFVDGGVGYKHSKAKVSGLSGKADGVEVGFRPGVALNVSDKVTILGTFGFLGYQYAKSGDTKTNNFGFDLDLRQTQLGVSFIF